MDTKTTVEEQKKNAKHVSDTLPVQQLYGTLARAPNSRTRHLMRKKKLLRCELHLESFHDQLAHFANTSSWEGLADYLNLIGTCRHNIWMRHCICWNGLTADDQVGVDYFAKEPQYYNHSELAVIN